MTEKPHKQAVCARCGAAIDLADCFQVSALDDGREAFLCRNEHIVGWLLRGGQWQFERPWEVAPDRLRAAGPVELVRTKGAARIERHFDDPDALHAWAVAGGLFGEGE